MVWEWACRFAARLSRHMTAAYGLLRTNRRAPSFNLSCLPAAPRLRVLHEESNPTTPRLVRASDADETIAQSEPFSLFFFAMSPFGPEPEMRACPLYRFRDMSGRYA